MENNHEIIKLRVQVFILDKKKKTMMKPQTHMSFNVEKAKWDVGGWSPLRRNKQRKLNSYDQ